MIVVMKTHADGDDRAAVLERLEEHQLRGHLSEGAERSVIGVVGAKIPEGLSEQLQSMSGVQTVVRISRPYKLAAREFQPHDTVIRVRNVEIGNGIPIVMAGPCSVESEDQILQTAHAVAAAGASILRGGAFKPRTSPYAFRGLGEAGLKLLAQARDETGLPIITEALNTQDVELVARYTDIIQIGARNMQNFALLKKIGRTRRPIMLKRGLASTLKDWLMSAEYIMAEGNPAVILCERGIRTFDDHSRFTFDLSAVPVLRELTHLPIIVDPSHATGRWKSITPMSRAGIASGADGLIIEVHPNPAFAVSDGEQSLLPERFADLMHHVERIAAALDRPVAGRASLAI